MSKSMLDFKNLK